MDVDTVMDVGGSAPPQPPQTDYAPSGSQLPPIVDSNSSSNGGLHACLLRCALHLSCRTPALTKLDRLYQEMRSIVASATQARDPFRDISVKMHIRRPDRDSWTYLGRGLISQEQSRIGESCGPRLSTPQLTVVPSVVRSAATQKVMTTFGEVSLCGVASSHTSERHPSGRSSPGREARQLRGRGLCRGHARGFVVLQRQSLHSLS